MNYQYHVILRFNTFQTSHYRREFTIKTQEDAIFVRNKIDLYKYLYNHIRFTKLNPYINFHSLRVLVTNLATFDYLVFYLKVKKKYIVNNITKSKYDKEDFKISLYDLEKLMKIVTSWD